MPSNKVKAFAEIDEDGKLVAIHESQVQALWRKSWKNKYIPCTITFHPSSLKITRAKKKK